MSEIGLIFDFLHENVNICSLCTTSCDKPPVKCCETFVMHTQCHVMLSFKSHYTFIIIYSFFRWIKLCLLEYLGDLWWWKCQIICYSRYSRAGAFIFGWWSSFMWKLLPQYYRYWIIVLFVLIQVFVCYHHQLLNTKPSSNTVVNYYYWCLQFFFLTCQKTNGWPPEATEYRQVIATLFCHSLENSTSLCQNYSCWMRDAETVASYALPEWKH